MLFWGIILFVLLVVVHELGHFLAAKRNGVEVEEFGIGFPPKLFGKKMGKGIMESYYTFNLLPLGGFVKLKGENSSDKRKGSFGAAPYRSQVIITVAGVLMNFVAAWVLLSIVAAVRMPQVIPNQFKINSATTVIEEHVDVLAVAEESPADRAGITADTSITSVANQPVNNLNDVNRLVEENAGQTVPVETVKTSDLRQAVADPEVTAHFVSLAQDPADGESYLGVGLGYVHDERTAWYAAPLVGAGLTAQFTWETLVLLGDLLTSPFNGTVAEASQGVTGPVGIFSIINNIESFTILLFVGGLISLSLGVMNILPIPALDGGRLAVTGIFKLLKKPLTEKTENAIHGTGMAVLLLLIILITIADVNRITG